MNNDKKRLNSKCDFFFRNVSLVDLAVLNNILHMHKERTASTVTALESAANVCQDKAWSPGMRREVGRLKADIRRVKTTLKSVPRLLKASLDASVEHHNPSVSFARYEQVNEEVDVGDNVVELAQTFFSTLRVTLIKHGQRLTLWDDTHNRFICGTDNNRISDGAFAHLYVSEPEGSRIIGCTFWLSVDGNKPNVVFAINTFDYDCAQYEQGTVKVVPKFARLSYRKV